MYLAVPFLYKKPTITQPFIVTNAEMTAITSEAHTLSKIFIDNGNDTLIGLMLPIEVTKYVSSMQLVDLKGADRIRLLSIQ